MERNEKFTHLLKLWTANLKHYVRNVECYDDIIYMARKIGTADIDSKEEVSLLDETLCWLGENVDSNLSTFVESCRRKFEELVN